jgi:choline dehydrogenase-like flavoprotein
VTQHDARKLQSGAEVWADICIVGAGAAGIALARELTRTDLTVCVLESGGLGPDKATQELAQGMVTEGYFEEGSDQYLLHSRIRQFGGTTNHWDGACAPLHAVDFEQRDWIPHSGWPFGLEELEPYYPRAAPVCGVKPFEGSIDKVQGRGHPIFELPEGSGLEHRIFHHSNDRRFGTKYRRPLQRSDDVSLYLWANAVEIVTNEDARAVMAIRVETLSGVSFLARARAYVLAAGGIENPRLMLNSNAVQKAGLGNANDLVGRYFMEHVFFHRNSLVISKPIEKISAYERTAAPDGKYDTQVVFSLSPELRREHELLDSNLRIRTAEPDEWHKHSDAVRMIASDLDEVHPTDSKIARLRFIPELAPNPNNRVRLGTDTDELGLRRVQLDWRLTDFDKDSWERTLRLFAGVFPLAIGGRVRLGDYVESIGHQSHHIGTLRMHRDPKRGVVDADCRVHGIDNLYVAGSAVFPTAGGVNPTLTIVAMSLRLAEHLETTLEPEAPEVGDAGDDD